MKVISGDALAPVEDAVKSRTDVQDILADSGEARVGAGAGAAASVWALSSVAPGLVLGGAAACRPCSLRAARVSCVVSAARELPDTPLPHADTPFLRVPVLDTVHDDLAPYFDLVADVIEQVRTSGGCTLVHCVAGVSRSASLCLAYLMRHCGLSLRDAFFHLRAQRSQVRPNTGFFKQLIKYEEEIFGKSTVKIVFNEAAGRDIPDVYEADYQDMMFFQQRYCRH